MASSSSSSSSSRSWRYDVFPSFSGEDVRKRFLSHLIDKLKRKLIDTFIDNGIERSRLIAPELLSAIRESRISIVVLSKKYASSTWCLNELVEIHKCFKELDQMVIPVFYEVDPSDVRKQTGEFGEAFEETCKGKTEDRKQSWKSALAEVASIAGYDFQRWDEEAKMIEQISNDVSNKLFTPSDDFGDFVGIDAHIEAMSSMLCLDSGEVRMVGIVGPSGIGKTTIARALFSRISRKFHRWVFLDKRTIQDQKTADFGVKLHWAKQLLSEILDEKEIKIDSLGVVKQRLKHKKVLIILDDVDDLDVLETLVEQTGCFGSGSRIIVVTQDRALLKSHEIDLTYEVEFPSRELALEMFCRSAFRRNSPPDGFWMLAAEVAELSGKLPLGLKVLGSSLRGKKKEKWVEMMPRLRNGLNGKIEKIIRVCYDGLDDKGDQDLFLYIACLFNGASVNYIKNLLGDRINIGLGVLAEKSLIRISPTSKTVQMHILLQKLGLEIVRAESKNNPGNRRFLVDVEDISDVFKDKTGTENVLGIHLCTSEINEPLFIDENSFEGMRNLQFIKFYKEWCAQKTGEVKFYLPPQGIVYLPRKLRLLHWDEYPAKYIPSNFTAEHLVELRMEDSKLKKLWEGTQPLRSLKEMNLHGSEYLKEIPDLSNATNLERLNLSRCTSLVTLPSSIRNLKKLRKLLMFSCSKLKVLPTDVSLESLDFLNLTDCSRLRSFPRISRNVSELYLDGTAMKEEDCLWIGNLSRLTKLEWDYCPLRCMPYNFNPEHLAQLEMTESKLEKLWEGVKPLANLENLDLSECKSLKEIPNLSNATNLKELNLRNCTSLVMLPSSIQYLHNLEKVDMRGCKSLEVLPTNINSGCSRLTSFPQLSTNIKELYLDDTGIEEVPSWIENIARLKELSMRGCKKLRKISATIWNLKHLEYADFTDCGSLTSVSDASLVKTDEFHSETRFRFHNCFNLDRDSQEFILQSDCGSAVLPMKQVPTYITHRTCGSSLSVPLPQSSLSQIKVGIKACIILENRATDFCQVIVHWKFRGVTGMCSSCPLDMYYRDEFGRYVNEMDHMVVFDFEFCCTREEVDVSPSQLDSNNVEFEFQLHNFYDCRCYSNHGTKDRNLLTCSILPHKIKEYGVLVVSVSPTMISEQQVTETLTNIFRQLHQENPSQSVETESERSNKRMRMTVISSQEHSNIPCGQTEDTVLPVPNLDLSLDPMITEQQDTETLIEDPSSSQQLINFLR